jgi:hypothetical protein
MLILMKRGHPKKGWPLLFVSGKEKTGKAPQRNYWFRLAEHI